MYVCERVRVWGGWWWLRQAIGEERTVGFSPVKQEALDLSSVNKASISSNVFGRSWKA